MSLSNWAKRSPANHVIILVAILSAIALNLHYKDKPSAGSAMPDSSDAAIASDPKIEALIMTVRWAEGTASEDGYRTIFTGEKFDNFDDHPRKINCLPPDANGKKLCSDASGIAQFLSPTFDRVAKKKNLSDFSPESQRIAMIELMKERGMIALLEKGDVAGAIAAGAEEWASLPRYNGDLDGVYNQSVKPMPSLLQKYEEYLK